MVHYSFVRDICSQTSLLQLVSQYICHAANKNSLFENGFQSLHTVKTIARQVARNVAHYNVPDHATPIFKTAA